MCRPRKLPYHYAVLCEIRRLTKRSKKKSRNARRRSKQKADDEKKAETEKKAAEWRSTRSEPDFDNWDKKKPKITLPLRGGEK
jgi:hypothetical protein